MRDRQTIENKAVGRVEEVLGPGRIVAAVGTAVVSFGDKKLGKLMEEAESEAVLECYALAPKNPDALNPEFIKEAKRKARDAVKAKYYSAIAKANAEEEARREEEYRQNKERKNEITE